MQRMCGMPCAGFWPARRSQAERRLGRAGWGLFFLWVGVAVLLDAGWGVGLLGVGLLTLTMQLVRHGAGLPIEGFWVLVGSAFAVAGAWKLAAIEASPGPILLIGLGAVLLLLSLRSRNGK